VDATAAFNLVELAALGRRAEFAVVNDSAPMHILSASPLPVYALFGPTDWRRSHGLGQAERVLINPVACSPCHRPVCPPGFDHRCLNELTPANVLARLAADGWFGRPEPDNHDDKTVYINHTGNSPAMPGGLLRVRPLGDLRES
jgi:hypothetical protein